jgi:hypothetical protein
MYIQGNGVAGFDPIVSTAADVDLLEAGLAP